MMSMIMLRLSSTKDLVSRMSYSLVLSERDFILDACDVMYARANAPIGKAMYCAAIAENAGVELLLDILKLWLHDDVVVRGALPPLTALASNAYGTEAEVILELGGRKLVEEIMERHNADDDVLSYARKLMKVLTGKGAAVAVKEMRLCVFCVMNGVDFSQAVRLVASNNRRERSGGGGPAAQIAPEEEPSTSTDAINAESLEAEDKRRKVENDKQMLETVVKHMRKYHAEKEVQGLGCEAFVEFGKRADPASMLTSGGIECVAQALRRFTTPPDVEFSIVWKVCLAVSYLAKHEVLASELGKRGVVPLLLAAFTSFQDRREIQQQVLWALESLARVWVNIERMKQGDLQKILSVLHKTDPDKFQVAVPLKLRKIFSKKELTGFKEKIVIKEKPKGRKAMVRRPRGKAKFGRAGDSYSEGSGGLLEDKPERNKGKGAAPEARAAGQASSTAVVVSKEGERT